MNPTTPKAPFEPLRANTVGALELATARLEKRLRRAARAITEGDLDQAEDLYTLAVTHLWELDPSRFDEDDDGYLWRSLVNCMVSARRKDEGNPTRPPFALRFP